MFYSFLLDHQVLHNIVACDVLKARTVKPAETAIARDWLRKYALC
jgi:hypothetical protein